MSSSMCLYSNNLPEKSKRSILCFKDLRKCLITRHCTLDGVTSVALKKPYLRHMSPYLNFKYTLREEMNYVELKPEKRSDFSKQFNWHDYTYSKGYHTFTGLNIEHLSHLYVAMIPKGVDYVRGDFAGCDNSFTSSNLYVIGSIWNPLSWIRLLFYKIKHG